MVIRRRLRHYRYQVLGAALGPLLGILIVSLLMELSLPWIIGLTLVLSGGSVLITLAIWWRFQDTLRAKGWEW